MVAKARHHTAPLDARGQRLDQHLAKVFPDLTRSRIQALLEAGQIRVEGRAAKASHRLRGGEAVAITVPEPVPALPQPEALPLSVLYEDAYLVVLDKGAGMVVHPGAGHPGGTLVNALLHRISDLRGVGGELRPGIVHRLDKETSGCLVVAKSDFALKTLQAAFQRREVDKRYLALVHGHPPELTEVETTFGRHPRHRQRFTGTLGAGKLARSTVRTMERLAEAALIEVALHTGRTHQARVHLAELGHPIVGDALYGGTRKGSPRIRAIQARLGRQALHAWRLAFDHPGTGERLQFEAPLPQDFLEALEALRR